MLLQKVQTLSAELLRCPKVLFQPCFIERFTAFFDGLSMFADASTFGDFPRPGTLRQSQVVFSYRTRLNKSVPRRKPQRRGTETSRISDEHPRRHQPYPLHSPSLLSYPEPRGYFDKTSTSWAELPDWRENWTPRKSRHQRMGHGLVDE